MTFAICDLNPNVREQLDAYGLTEAIGTDRIFATTTTCWRPTGPPRTRQPRSRRLPRIRHRAKAERAVSPLPRAPSAAPPAGRRRPGAGRPRTPAGGRRPTDPTRSRSSRSRRRPGSPELVPIRYGRMAVSPFTFYRGAALPMAADLSATPDAGIVVQLCGDAHLSNFGLFASPERDLVFDVNDFDETLHGPSSGTSSASPPASWSRVGRAGSTSTASGMPSTAPSPRTAPGWPSTRRCARSTSTTHASTSRAILAFVDKRARPFLAGHGPSRPPPRRPPRAAQAHRRSTRRAVAGSSTTPRSSRTTPRRRRTTSRRRWPATGTDRRRTGGSSSTATSSSTPRSRSWASAASAWRLRGPAPRRRR